MFVVHNKLRPDPRYAHAPQGRNQRKLLRNVQTMYLCPLLVLVYTHAVQHPATVICTIARVFFCQFFIYKL